MRNSKLKIKNLKLGSYRNLIKMLRFACPPSFLAFTRNER